MKFKQIKSSDDLNDDLKYNLEQIYRIYQNPLPENLFDDEDLLYKLFNFFDKDLKKEHFYIFLDFIGKLKYDGVALITIDEFLKNREIEYKNIYQKFDVLVKLEKKLNFKG